VPPDEWGVKAEELETGVVDMAGLCVKEAFEQETNSFAGLGATNFVGVHHTFSHHACGQVTKVSDAIRLSIF
jgi:hypothetical protein